MKVILSLALLSLITGSLVMAQKPDEATRKLWDTAFIATAPASKTKTTSRRRSSSKYRIATPNVPIDNVVPESVVGVTIWRLRPAGRSESGERIIVHDDSKEWVPERISANTKLGAGDRLRISVEAARNGYLYVIDRELYADGTLGEPYLIFPTTRTLGGDNKVSVGKLAEIPAQEDSPPFFTIRKSRLDQVAEVVSVLVTPEPLEGVEITEKAQKLTDAQVASWEKSWSTRVGRLEMENVGQTWTKAEKDAGAMNTRALTASAPAPQMLFYRPKSNDGIFVKLRLSYRR